MQRQAIDNFHLIDLASQAWAVQTHLWGMPSAKKLAWLCEHGEVTQIFHADGRFPDTYRFRSKLGLEVAFFLDGDEFVFVGDTTWLATPPANGGVA